MQKPVLHLRDNKSSVKFQPVVMAASSEGHTTGLCYALVCVFTFLYFSRITLQKWLYKYPVISAFLLCIKNCSQ